VPRIQKGVQEAFHFVYPAASAQVWSGLDIGGPGAIGSGLPNGSLVTLHGAGTGINTSGNDQGYFVSTPRTGDVEMVVKVLQVTGGGRSQVGIMLRESTNANADMACALYEVPTSGNLLVRQAYRRLGYAINNTNTAPISVPVWLKLQRVGKTYATFRSTDGLVWVPISNYAGGGFTPANFLAGLFISGGGAAATADAQLEIVYLGAPRLEYRTTWLGNTFSNDVDRYVSHGISALYVGADGRCFTNSPYDEAGEATKIYQDGKVVSAIRDVAGNTWGNTCIGSHCNYSGTITGDGQYVYLVKGPVTEAGTGKVLDQVIRTNWNGTNSVAVTLTSKPEIIGGMAAGNGEIYFSDVNNNQILVASATTLTELPARKFAFTRPGPMTVDRRGNLWIIQRATDHPVGPMVQYAAAIRCYKPDGTFTGKEITDVVNPTAVAIDPTQDRLLVAEGGPAQNIRFYNLSGSTPVLSGTFGIAGGLTNPPNPGRINDEANGGYQRLSFPYALGMDAQGNLYVSCGGIGSDLRKYDVNGNLVWQLNGLAYVSVPDFDPATDGNDLYWFAAHVTMDYDKTAPGSEWRYTGLSRNLFAPTGQQAPTGANTIIRRLGPNNERFMFTVGVPPFDINIYRFQGEIAVPCGAYGYKTVNGAYVERMWVDLNGDGIETTEELYIPAYEDRIHLWSALDIDEQGNLLIKQTSHNFYTELAGTKKIRRIQFQGQSAQGIPLYKLAKDGYTDIQIPFEIAYPFHFRYIPADDAMYFVGFTYAQKHVLARYDNWSQPNRALRYLQQLPTPRDSTNFFSFPPYVGTPDFQKIDPSNPDAEFHYFALDVAGDKVFIGELWGPIHVYDANLGNPITRFDPGPEVSGVAGWTDIRQGVRAFKRSTGEYAVVREDAGIRARNLLFRWTPATPTAPPAAPVRLKADGGSNRITLSWEGGWGQTRKFAVWRGTSSGGETLYADNLTVPSFADTNVQFGTTYYYRVTAANDAGTSGFSNEVSANANAAARFSRFDVFTEGNWKGVYGQEGYDIVGDSSSFPSSIKYVTNNYDPNQFVRATNSPYLPATVTVKPNTTDPEYLMRAASGERVWAFWNKAPITIDLNLTDGLEHQVALYYVHTDSLNAQSTAEVLDIHDNLLDRRTLASANDGRYAVWKISGRVKIVITFGSPGTDVVGVFVDPVSAIPAACSAGAAPTIVTVQPQGVTACVGQSVTFTVQATGQNLSYQWRHAEQPIAGANGPSFTIPSLKFQDWQGYDVIVTGACGSDISLSAFVPRPQSPPAQQHPASHTVNEDTSTTFTTSYSKDEAGPVSTQWQVSTDNGQTFSNISGGAPAVLVGANFVSTLTLPAVTNAQNGNRYRAVFTNPCGMRATNAAILTVTPVNDAPQAVKDEAQVITNSPPNRINVLANDTDEENDALTVSGVTHGQHGTTTITPDSKAVTYQPAAGYFGTDAFTYTVSDGNGGTATATVNVRIENTAAGKGVCVTQGGVKLCFDQVTVTGDTTVTSIAPETAGTLPQGFTLSSNSVAFEIKTTATFTGPITITFNVASVTNEEDFNRLRVLHGENGQLIDRTIFAPGSPAPNIATREISARVDSLSPFVVAVAPLPQPPIVAGSVLVFPLYTSTIGNAAVNTRLNFTNIDPTRLAYVHVFFVSNQDCTVADTVLCLTPNQTASFLASDFDPGTTGYVIAVAVDAQGCPINFNNLIGSEFVKLTSGHAASFEAQAIAALPTGVFTCNAAAPSATLNFDGVQYSMLPQTLAVNNVASPADGNDTLLVLDRIGGDFYEGQAARLSNLAGLVYNDREIGYSFVQGTSQCQLIGRLNTGFPRTSPPLHQIIPKGRTGWLRFNQSDNSAMIGVLMNLNPNGFNQGHYLHVLRYTTAALTIPVYAPTCVQ